MQIHRIGVETAVVSRDPTVDAGVPIGGQGHGTGNRGARDGRAAGIEGAARIRADLAQAVDVETDRQGAAHGGQIDGPGGEQAAAAGHTRALVIEPRAADGDDGAALDLDLGTRPLPGDVVAIERGTGQQRAHHLDVGALQLDDAAIPRCGHPRARGDHHRRGLEPHPGLPLHLRRELDAVIRPTEGDAPAGGCGDALTGPADPQAGVPHLHRTARGQGHGAHGLQRKAMVEGQGIGGGEHHLEGV